MIAPTHITFAEFIYLLILTTAGIALSPANALTMAIASLLADVDTEASRIGRLLPFISRRIEKRFGHRTLTHSLLFIIVLGAALFPLLLLSLNLNLSSNIDLYLCFITGYASHPFLDTMTVNGVRLFYPFSNLKCVFPLEVNQPHRYRVQSGSKVDKTLAILFAIGCIPTFLIAHQGYERFVRFTQQSIESAVRDYNEFSRTHSVFAEITAHDLLTKEQISGRYEIAGALDDHTLLFEGKDKRLHTVGKEYHAEYVAENVLCVKGAAVSTSIRSIDMTSQTLGLLANYIQPGEKTLFFGVLQTKDNVLLPPDDREFSPVEGTSGHIVFNHASMEDMRQLRLENLLIEQGTLIARSLVPVTNPDSGSTHISSPYSEVSFPATTNQSVHLVARMNDTVVVGQTLATLSLAAPIEAQIQLQRNQREALKGELNQKLTELQTRIEKKVWEVRQDSLIAQSQNELQNKGFSTQSGNIQDFRRSRGELPALANSQSVLREKYSLRIQKLNTEILRLQAKRNVPTQSESIIRATVDGIITDIRQTHEGTKRRTTFIIRRVMEQK